MPELERDDLEARLAALRQNVENPPTSDKRVDPVKVYRTQMFKTTAGALQAAVENNPEHPVAMAYRKSLRGKPANKELTVNLVDVQALLDDLDVLTEESSEEGVDEEGPITRIVVTKKLGKKRQRKAGATEAKPVMLETHQVMQPEELARHRREVTNQSATNPDQDAAANAKHPEERPAPVKGPGKDPENFNQLDLH